MSNNIDERVVSMKFNNGQFESGVQKTLDTLDKLRAGLNLQGATASINELDAAGKKFSLDGMAENVDKIASHFSAMSVIAITAISNIVNKAVDAGLRLTKSLALDSVINGYSDYGKKLTSVQTIMNATGASIQTVGTYFDQLDTYADKTIYNLSDMTGAFAKFTNAGVSMDKSIPAIKGIANMVALAGQDAGAAQIAMYNLSQSIAGGFLTTTDYKSLNLANVATAEWKQNMVDAAVAAGKLQDAGGGAYSIVGAQAGKAFTPAQLFNEQLSEGWASADILLGVLGQYGDTTTEIGKKAQGAAQDVKSFSMMMDTLKAAAGTGWTDTFQIVIGNVEEAKALFTPLTNAIGDFLGKTSDARNQLLQTWKDLGGRDTLIQGFASAFKALGAIITPIKDAFKEFFPPMTAQRLFDITKGFADLAAKMMPSVQTLNELKRTFKGVFAVIDTVRLVLFELGIVFKLVFDKVDGGNTSILKFTARIGDWLVKIHDAIQQSDKFAEFFINLADWISKPINLLKQFAHWVGQLFDSFKMGDNASGTLDRVNDRLNGMKSIGDALESMWANLWGWMKNVWAAFAPIRDGITQFFNDLGGRLGESLKTMDFGGILDMINTGIFAGLLLLLKKFMKNGVNIDVGGGFLGSLKNMFGELTGVMKAMQTELKAEALQKIAIALGIMTISIVALSLIDSAALTKALIAIGLMFTELAGGMALMDKTVGGGGAVKLAILGVALIGLSVAVLILAAAVAIFSALSWEDLVKGFAGLTVALGLMVGVSKLLDDASGPMLRAGIALGVVATSVLILAAAVKIFSMMSWEEMGKGFAGVVTALGAMALFTKLAEANKGALASSGALLIMAGALLIVAQVVQQFGSMDTETLAKGLAAMAASLILIAFAVTEMSGALTGAAAFAVVAASLYLLKDVLTAFGAMSWVAIAKAAAMLLTTFILIEAGIAALSVPILLVGAANLLIVAAALAILGPVLVAFGNMSWESIGKGLVMLAGAFLVIGVAGALLTPTIPTLLGLGVAITLLGVGILAAGVGILAFSVGLTALGAAAGVGALAITAIFSAIIAQIPMAIAALANGIVEFAGILANSGPVFVAAITTLLLSLIMAIDAVAPQLIDTLTKIVLAGINAIAALVPVFVDKGYQMIAGILQGIAKNLPAIITAATNVIIAFINGIGASALRIANAGADMIITFVNGLAASIRTHTAEMNRAGDNLADAIVDGMVSGITSGASRAIKAATDLAKGVLNAAKKFLGIASPSKEFTKVGEWNAEGMAIGMDNGAKDAAQSAHSLGKAALEGLKSSLSNADKLMSNIGYIAFPSIRPVLDLSGIKEGAKQIDGLLVPSSIIPTTSYEQASSISADTQATQAANEDISANAPVVSETNINFTQNNNSPKELSAAEIYRNTKNQLSVAKGGLPS